MRVTFSALLAECFSLRKAIGAFTCYDLETARGVLAASVERDSPVILLVSASIFEASGGDEFVAALQAAAERSPARACVQLDHVSDLELIRRGFDLGCGAVMADGSRLTIEQNTALVAAAVRIASQFRAGVEAELGYLTGDEDIARLETPDELTAVDDVVPFLKNTGADCLAVSIGNVHGHYSRTPRLDWELLAAIRQVSNSPLSLHGASGLGYETIRRAISGGIVKVNLNTELREAYLSATARALPDVRGRSDLLSLHRSQIIAIRDVVAKKLLQFEDATR